MPTSPHPDSRPNPETLAAPLLLLLIEARLQQRSAHFWLWFLLTLSVKENIALLLVTFSIVWIGLDWKKSPAWNLRWNFLPLAVATTWLLICLQIISPMLNAGHVDYLQLYAPLGSTSGEIVRHFFTEPHRVSHALWRALSQGNLLPSLLLPFLLLPLLRPRWLCIASPLILQHLLSSRSSEWSIGAHYPAPLLPLFWIATAEVVSKVDRQKSLAFILLATTLLAHAFSGPTRQLLAEIPHLHDQLEEREAKAQLLDAIPDTASVTAPLPYLSHLATRKNLVSLHHVLKGLQTLSTTLYTPPLATDFVVVDYADPFTFSTVAGYYHPQMRTNHSAVVESSDRLLHEYLRSASWKVRSLNSLTIFTKGHPAPIPLQNADPLVFDSTTTLQSIEQIRDEPTLIQLRFGWKFTGERQRFPWGMLVLSNGQHLYPIIKGAASPQIAEGEAGEDWTCVFPSHLPHGDYSLFLLFFDHNQAAWESKLPPNDPTFTQHKIPLGNHRIPSPP
ncbi:MAG: DUF2079 domain-containing protein [Verrucomicrobia bacterium]|nr:DUF2079 domain-containing protein [Verrucomicrobiota bacterium]